MSCIVNIYKSHCLDDFPCAINRIAIVQTIQVEPGSDFIAKHYGIIKFKQQALFAAVYFLCGSLEESWRREKPVKMCSLLEEIRREVPDAAKIFEGN